MGLPYALLLQMTVEQARPVNQSVVTSLLQGISSSSLKLVISPMLPLCPPVPFARIDHRITAHCS